MLTLARDLLALRRQTPDLHAGSYRAMASPEGVWAWRRGDRMMVALNMSDEDTTLAATAGRIRIATDRTRDGESFDKALFLHPWEGVIAEIL
jgi:glycosidase